MTLMYLVRDLLQNPRRILDKAQLGEGMNVADCGCGPGNEKLVHLSYRWKQ
jgi:cyclopropane fatty-acyl-phospholipid synthase-like methyltransferase